MPSEECEGMNDVSAEQNQQAQQKKLLCFNDATGKLSYKIADINLADLGRKALSMAEGEMPGVIRLKKLYGPKKPLQGVRLAGCIHVTAQTGVMIEALREMGAEVNDLFLQIHEM